MYLNDTLVLVGGPAPLKSGENCSEIGSNRWLDSDLPLDLRNKGLNLLGKKMIAT
jgi:hypothetical protein